MAGATIFDVAKTVGVSPSTVSRALNGGMVSDATRAKIVRAADQLGYRPNTAARELVTGRKGAVGVLVTDIGNYYSTDQLRGLFSAAQAKGYRISIADVTLSDDLEATVRDMIATTQGQIVLSPRFSDDKIGAWFSPDSTVLASRQCNGFDNVVMDDAGGVAQAVRHLASLGHRCVAYVSGTEHSWSNGVRADAFERSCEQYGIDGVVLGNFEPSYEGGASAADAVMLETGVTGVVVFNDLMACGLMGALQGRGVKIPEELSVVGIDDSMLARTVTPRLTSVTVRQERLGVMAMQMLIDKLEGDGTVSRLAGGEPASTMVPELLVARDSTARAPR